MFEDIQGKFGRILKNIRGQGKITEKNVSDSMREVRRALLDADVNFKVVKKFTQRVIDKATGDVVFDSVKPGQQFIKIILDELILVLGNNKEEIQFGSPVTTIVLAGLQGSGKTTTSVKIAQFLKNNYKKNPCLIAADLQRPAAIDQLESLSKSVDIPVFSNRDGNAIDSVKTKSVSSIDQKIGDEGNRTLGDIIPDDQAQSVDDLLDQEIEGGITVLQRLTGRDYLDYIDTFSGYPGDLFGYSIDIYDGTFKKQTLSGCSIEKLGNSTIIQTEKPKKS